MMNTELHQELRQKYNPDGSTLRQMQERMLVILKTFDEICHRHNIPYWLSGGTLLGSIRHEGFIPWDDDLDVDMLRPDFERLMRLLPEELPDTMALQWHTTDPNYFFQYAKIRDRNSLLAEHNGYDRVWKERGIYIDIFPLERMPVWIHKISMHTLGHTYKMMRTAEDVNRVMPRVRALATLNRRVVFPVLRGLAKLFRSPYYDFALGIPYIQRTLKDDIFPLRYVPFEDMTTPIMNKTEKSLTARFGDFMSLPKNPGSQFHADDVKIFPLENR